jgi:WD40 repeat protein
MAKNKKSRTAWGLGALVAGAVLVRTGALATQQAPLRAADHSPRRPRIGLERVLQLGHHHGVQAVAFSPDGATLAIGGWDDLVWLYDLHTRQIRRTLAGHTGSVTSVAFSPDGATVVSGGYDGAVKLWDAHSGVLERTLDAGDYHVGGVTSVAFSRDGKTVASAGFTTVDLWDTQTGQLKHRLGPVPGIAMVSVAFSPDGKILASGGGDLYESWGAIRLWDVPSGRLLLRRPNLVGVGSVVFSSDGATLASVGEAFRDVLPSRPVGVSLWDTRTGSLKRTLPGGADSITSLAFSADGEMLVGGSYGGTVKLWDARTGRLMEEVRTGKHSVNSVALSPDGKTFASGGDEGTKRRRCWAGSGSWARG